MPAELQSPFIDLRIIDMRGIDPERLRDEARFNQDFYGLLVEDLELTPVEHPDNPLIHKFIPSEGNLGEGISGMILIKESHGAFHGWDEEGHLRIDIETCAKVKTLDQLPYFLIRRFQPSVFMISKIANMEGKHQAEQTETYIRLEPDDPEYQPGRYRVFREKLINDVEVVLNAPNRKARVYEETVFYYPESMAA